MEKENKNSTTESIQQFLDMRNEYLALIENSAKMQTACYLLAIGLAGLLILTLVS
jgi:hypothetical protein